MRFIRFLRACELGDNTFKTLETLKTSLTRREARRRVSGVGYQVIMNYEKAYTNIHPLG